MVPVPNVQTNVATRQKNRKKQKLDKGLRAINISKEALRAQKFIIEPTVAPTSHTTQVACQVGPSTSEDPHQKKEKYLANPTQLSSPYSMDGIMAQIPSLILVGPPAEELGKNAALEESKVQKPNQPRPPNLSIRESDMTSHLIEQMDITTVGAPMAHEGRSLERDHNVMRHCSHSRDHRHGNCSWVSTDILASFQQLLSSPFYCFHLFYVSLILECLWCW